MVRGISTHCIRVPGPGSKLDAIRRVGGIGHHHAVQYCTVFAWKENDSLDRVKGTSIIAEVISLADLTDLTSRLGLRPSLLLLWIAWPKYRIISASITDQWRRIIYCPVTPKDNSNYRTGSALLLCIPLSSSGPSGCLCCGRISLGIDTWERKWLVWDGRDSLS